MADTRINETARDAGHADADAWSAPGGRADERELLDGTAGQ
jgi:hypothetical protein